MKRVSIIFLVIGILGVAGYMYLRSSLKTKKTINVTGAIPAKEAGSILDLRPKLISKLQQLVKVGSGGLYNLSIEEIEPDILSSKLKIKNAILVPDTAVVAEFDSLKKLPNDLFKIKFQSLQIEGIGLKDILSKDVIDLESVFINNSVIDVYHRKRAYNKKTEPDSLTIYQRLMQQMKRIAINRIMLKNGRLVNHNLDKKKTTIFNDVSVNLSDLLIDSTTQYDKERFFFAKSAELSVKNYVFPTLDNLYDFKIGSLSVSGNNKSVIAKDIHLIPRYSKKEFIKKINRMDERYELSAASVLFKDIDWWKLTNEEGLIAKDAEVKNALFNIYLDRSLPLGKIKQNSFPHQLLMKLPLPVSIRRLKINNITAVYEEFNPKSGKTGKFILSNLKGVAKNITNIASQINRNRVATVSLSGSLMNKVPIKGIIRFDLSKYKSGVFSADLSTSGFDGTMFNSVAEPLGLFRVKRGKVKATKAHFEGNNTKGTGRVQILYENLHITPLQKDESKATGLKKKSVTSFIANKFIIKNENPSGNDEIRNADASFDRNPYKTFFNLIWKTMLVGVLKTVGAPERLAYK